ncbi:heavy metal translocating P-type ATPase [Qipengyuania sp.]|uniref:heavy metal translocating P-type ATPase n=1 Tax=Qipengyuania sp. TaxID=2004515 RepID=UPI0035C7B083
MNAPIAIDTELPGALDTRLTVPGIRCAGCIAKIERELPRMAGVASARVNFSAKRVAIRHDARVDEQALVSALEGLGFEAQPVAANPLAQDDREVRSLLRALAVAGFGMMNIMLLSVSVWSGAQGGTRELFHWLSAIIALPVIGYAGRPFFASAWMALRYRRTNMDVPISIGVLLAAGLSLYETVTRGPHAYFDSAVMLLFFLLAGRALDAAMRGRTRAGIGALLSRMGRSASVVRDDGSTRQVKAEDLEPGLVMLVAAGEALAADGVIKSGESMIDKAMLTGESELHFACPGDLVHAGTINVGGPITVRITAAAADTVLADIARLMDEAGQSRSRYVRIADRAARLYAPAVHSLAALAIVGWLLAGAGWHQALIIGIAVLIITCPCAIGLAVPAAQVVAAGALGRQGLLVKDGSALERLAEIDVALFDKTGTLTIGEPRPDFGEMPARAKAVALALAQQSRHPLSRSIAASLTSLGVEPARINHVREIAGEGLFARWGDIPVSLQRTDHTKGSSSSLEIGTEAWVIDFSDQLRPDAADAIRALTSMGIKSRIVSGDRPDAVSAVGETLGLRGDGGMRPQDKLSLLEELKAQGRRPLMIGDGLNDGPALAGAHASIAPGSASDISQQAADAVFVGERLMPVAVAVSVARKTMTVVRQNFTLAVVYNALAVPLAVMGFVTPLIAAIAMSLSSLIVVGNSLRLMRAAR